jgi:hypothetical protein
LVLSTERVVHLLKFSLVVAMWSGGKILGELRGSGIRRRADGNDSARKTQF